MAQTFVTDAGTLTIPSSVASFQVQTGNSGLATNGVLMLVGEADAGPRFDKEETLQDNAFGSDSLSAVVAKYQSGPLVDAYRAAVSPSNDPNIIGAPSQIVMVKTNDSTRAQSALTVHGGGAYQTPASAQVYLAAKNYGKSGNAIYYTIAQKTAEALPTTGAFTLLLPIASTDINFRVNGGSAVALTLTALQTPASAVSAINALSGVAATGGTSRGLLGGVSGNLALVASSNQVTVTYSGTWGTTPSVGDTFYIPSGSVLAGGFDQNLGSYVVTAATSNSITATKLLDASGTPGSNTAPASVTSQAVAATTDVQAWGPVIITLEAGNPILGVGKTLEINELTSASDRLSNLCYALSGTKVTWVSKSGSAKVLTSASEYAVTLNVNRQRDNIQEALNAGGEIALKVGYTGTTATLTIDDTTLTTSVTGGSGTNLNLDLKDFETIQDLATYINSQTGYKADVGTAILGQLPSTALDNVTAQGICTQFGSETGQLKVDAYRFFNKVNGESVLVQVQDAMESLLQAAAGLPQPVSTTTYLAGGAKGSTSDSDVLAAFTALEQVRGNFLVPLFSRDASADVTDKLTESASSYTIAAIHTNARAHVLKMSALKRKKNRQAFLSIRSSFSTAKNTASNMASFRTTMTFMDVRTTDSNGVVKQFQPWMGAVNAAAMQAAGFYRAIVNKFAAVNGAIQAAKDFDPANDDQVEEALTAGLLPMRRADTGGWYWVSDQTTYGKDSNFVFNSIQAVSTADIVALTLAQRFQTAFVGQSTADVNAALARAFLESIMEDLLRLKLIARSDDAPKGFKNASIKINGNTMIVQLEIKLAGAIYFIPISFLVSQVQQTA